jgi:hypothetical protein
MRRSQRVNICEGRASDFDVLMHLSVRGVDAEQRAGDDGRGSTRLRLTGIALTFTVASAVFYGVAFLWMLRYRAEPDKSGAATTG